MIDFGPRAIFSKPLDLKYYAYIYLKARNFTVLYVPDGTYSTPDGIYSTPTMIYGIVSNGKSMISKIFYCNLRRASYRSLWSAIDYFLKVNAPV